MINNEFFKTQPNYNSKAPIWLLYVGLFFFLGGTILINILPGISENNTDNPIEVFLQGYPRLLVIAVIIFIGPIIEEIGFRAWQLNITILRLISIVIIVGYSYLAFPNLLIALILLPILLLLMVYKPNYWKRIIAILLTSIIFAFLHYGNYTGGAQRLWSIVTLFGFSIILNYLTWRFSIIWAFVLHFANNGLALYLTDKVTTLKTENYSIRIEKHLGLKQVDIEYDSVAGIINYQGTISSFTNFWINNAMYDTSVVYTDNGIYPDLTIEIKYQNSVNRNQLLDTLLHTLGYQLDTAYLNAYKLELPNSSDTIDILDGTQNSFVYNLLAFKNELSSKGLNINRNDDDSLRYVRINNHLLQPSSSVENIIAVIKANELNIYEDTTRKVKIVSLKTLK